MTAEKGSSSRSYLTQIMPHGIPAPRTSTACSSLQSSQSQRTVPGSCQPRSLFQSRGTPKAEEAWVGIRPEAEDSEVNHEQSADSCTARS